MQRECASFPVARFRFHWLWCLQIVILFLCLLLIVKSETEYKLKLTQLVYRHGARAPGRTFDSDKWQEDTWPDGLGQLTKVGINQQYELGEYLRERYGSFLNGTSILKSVYVRSTDVDRTLMSAYSNLAGFFPPKESLIQNKNIKWQPIPVHTTSSQDDYVISYVSKCPLYDELYNKELNSEEAIEINNKYKELYDFLTNKTKRIIKDFNQASNIYKIFIAEQTHNLSLPKWANKTILADLKTTETLFLSWQWRTRDLCRLRGGPLVGEIVKNMNNVINKTDQRKLYMFSAHDCTIVSLLSALDVFEPHVPPYCSTVMIELLEKDNSFYVKILYRNDTTRDPYELILKSCSNPCPFHRFEEITASVIPLDIKNSCFEKNKKNPVIINAITGTMLGFLGLLLIVLGCYWFGKRKADEQNS